MRHWFTKLFSPTPASEAQCSSPASQPERPLPANASISDAKLDLDWLHKWIPEARRASAQVRAAERSKLAARRKAEAR